MAKNTVTLFEIRSKLEALSNLLHTPGRHVDDVNHVRDALDILIAQIQQDEMGQFGVKFSFSGHRSATRFFSSSQERNAFAQSLLLCPCCDAVSYIKE